MMLSKPCGRAARGCDRAIEAPGPRTLAARQFCSVRCAVLARMEAGWKPQDALTPAQRQLGGRRGGKTSGLHKRKRAMVSAVAELERFLTPEFLEGLLPDQAARVRVLLARAYRRGHRRGYRAGFWGRTNRRKAAA